MKTTYLIPTLLLSLISLTSCNIKKPTVNKDSNTQIEENQNNNESENNNNNEDGFDSDNLEVPSLHTVNYKEISSKFENKNIDLTNKENQKDLLYYSFYKFSNSKSSLALDYAETDSMNGLMKENNLRLKLNNRGFNEHEAFTANGRFQDVHFAYRNYYENEFSKINQYFGQTLDEVTKQSIDDKIESSLANYINKNGKLDFNQYQVDKDNKFLKYGISNYLNVIDTTSIFQFNNETIKDFKFKKLENTNYQLDYKILSKFQPYFATRIKTNLGLAKNPSLDELIDCSFIVDKDFNLISSTSKCVYKSTSYGVQVTNMFTSLTKYFSSNNLTLKVNNKDLFIPNLNEKLNLTLDKNFNITFN